MCIIHDDVYTFYTFKIKMKVNLADRTIEKKNQKL